MSLFAANTRQGIGLGLSLFFGTWMSRHCSVTGATPRKPPVAETMPDAQFILLLGTSNNNQDYYGVLQEANHNLALKCVQHTASGPVSLFLTGMDLAESTGRQMIPRSVQGSDAVAHQGYKLLILERSLCPSEST